MSVILGNGPRKIKNCHVGLSFGSPQLRPSVSLLKSKG